MAETDAVVTATVITDATPRSTVAKPPKKRRGAVHFFRAALFVLRGKSKKPHLPPASTNAQQLSRLVGSMRPLYLENATITTGDKLLKPSEMLLPAPTTPAVVQAVAPVVADAASSSSSSVDGMSRYASAQNLQELDEAEEEVMPSVVVVVEEDEDEEEDSDAYYDGIAGDEMIDSKAEEFIAQFYHQMRLQSNFASSKLHH